MCGIKVEDGNIQIPKTAPFFCQVCVCSTVMLLVCILFPISFQYVRFNEFAFAKNTLSNTIATSTVYKPGRYMLGPSIDMVPFPQFYQTEEFKDGTALSVFNSEGMEIIVDVYFAYKITAENVGNLMTKYGTNYKSKVRSVGQATLKNAAMETIQKYVKSREEVGTKFNQQVTSAMNNIFLQVDDYKLLMGNIQLPEAQMNKFMEDAVILQNAQKYQFEQQAKIIRDETDRDTNAIMSNVTFVQREASAKAQKTIEENRALADRMRANVTATGWLVAMSDLGITVDNDRKEFLRLVSILDNPTTPKVVDKDLDVIIPASG